MERLSLLNNESNQEDQSLETDVMRFVAIIGIIFWIIFTLIKSIPLEEVKPESKATPVAASEISEEKIVLPVDTVKLPAQKIVIPPKEELPQEKMVNEPPKLEEATLVFHPSVEIATPELLLQFASREDLLTMLSENEVQIFGHAKTEGFELFFASSVQDDSVQFKGADILPAKMWEIKSGSDQEYFLNLLSETYPAIHSFLEKRILVAFADSSFDSLVEERFGLLQQQGRYGILSIGRAGLTFDENALEGLVSQRPN